MRTGAVEMRGLVPDGAEVVLAGLRRVEVIVLIAVTNVHAPDVDLVETISASRRDREIPKRAWFDRAVLIEFG